MNDMARHIHFRYEKLSIPVMYQSYHYYHIIKPVIYWITLIYVIMKDYVVTIYRMKLRYIQDMIIVIMNVQHQWIYQDNWIIDE